MRKRGKAEILRKSNIHESAKKLLAIKWVGKRFKLCSLLTDGLKWESISLWSLLTFREENYACAAVKAEQSVEFAHVLSWWGFGGFGVSWISAVVCCPNKQTIFLMISTNSVHLCSTSPRSALLKFFVIVDLRDLYNWKHHKICRIEF